MRRMYDSFGVFIFLSVSIFSRPIAALTFARIPFASSERRGSDLMTASLSKFTTGLGSIVEVSTVSSAGIILAEIAACRIRSVTCCSATEGSGGVGSEASQGSTSFSSMFSMTLLL